ncbi:hypothetical protein E2C01_094392 [Portunus trituberculatus]|uniref:Uncharacterized protein n=1 Tax=Portunus trituberculatus TaxID=210409 RepID=A0A5B7JQB3_PORTR|nr:hypothetical protein [Portunus trituberculatus]
MLATQVQYTGGATLAVIVVVRAHPLLTPQSVVPTSPSPQTLLRSIIALISKSACPARSQTLTPSTALPAINYARRVALSTTRRSIHVPREMFRCVRRRQLCGELNRHQLDVCAELPPCKVVLKAKAK